MNRDSGERSFRTQDSAQLYGSRNSSNKGTLRSAKWYSYRRTTSRASTTVTSEKDESFAPIPEERTGEKTSRFSSRFSRVTGSSRLEGIPKSPSFESEVPTPPLFKSEATTPASDPRKSERMRAPSFRPSQEFAELEFLLTKLERLAAQGKSIRNSLAMLPTPIRRPSDAPGSIGEQRILGSEIKRLLRERRETADSRNSWSRPGTPLFSTNGWLRPAIPPIQVPPSRQKPAAPANTKSPSTAEPAYRRQYSEPGPAGHMARATFSSPSPEPKEMAAGFSGSTDDSRQGAQQRQRGAPPRRRLGEGPWKWNAGSSSTRIEPKHASRSPSRTPSPYRIFVSAVTNHLPIFSKRNPKPSKGAWKPTPTPSPNRQTEVLL